MSYGTCSYRRPGRDPIEPQLLEHPSSIVQESRKLEHHRPRTSNLRRKTHINHPTSMFQLCGAYCISISI